MKEYDNKLSTNLVWSVDTARPMKTTCTEESLIRKLEYIMLERMFYICWNEANTMTSLIKRTYTNLTTTL